jgi:MFS family permease
MNKPRLTTLQKKRRLPFALAGESFNVVFAYLVFFGSVFPLFLDSLKLDKKQIGLLLSLMPFCALIAPIIGATLSRVGLKRCFLLFWVLRKLAAAMLIAVPWVLIEYGPQTTFIYVVASVGAFAVFRAVAETAYFPWNQEFVPATIRGKYSATQQIVAMLTGAATVTAASFALGDNPEPKQFAVLVSIAVVMGLISASLFAFVPGGAPVRDIGSRGATRHGMALALRDKRFMLYMGGLTLVIFGASAAIPFVPLFMKEQVGLAAGMVVRLESAAMLAGLASCFIWGWAADRYGAKPVMVTALLLFAVYPAGLLVIPRQSTWSMHIAFGLVGFMGMVNPGWAIGSSKQLFVEIVPEEHKTGYLSLYYAWIGLVGGIAPLIAGFVLNLTKNLDGRFFFIPLDPYVPLFATHVVVLILAVTLFSRLPSTSDMGIRRFAGMFLQGNPFAAMQSMVAHNLARSEGDRIASIRRLGEAESPLTVEELLAAINDPSFNVRMEAIVTMARARNDPRLTDALLKVVSEMEPDLAMAAVWALGRTGDRRAIEPLRELLLGDYPVLAARSARSLAQLDDREVIPLLLARLRDELDSGLRLAYAAALGALRHEPALPEILDFLRACPNESARRELVLAVARIIGDEIYIIRLWRRLEPDPGTTLSESLFALRKPLIRALDGTRETTHEIDQIIHLIADNDIASGIARLPDLIERLPLPDLDPSICVVLEETAGQMQKHGIARMEYLILTLHALQSQLRPPRE